jgi:isocitrate lyase
MTSYAALQEQEFELEAKHGYRAIKHQSFVGAGYFDALNTVITSGQTATKALEGSTEEEQFDEKTPEFVDAEVHHVGSSEAEDVPEPPHLID